MRYGFSSFVCSIAFIVCLKWLLIVASISQEFVDKKVEDEEISAEQKDEFKVSLRCNTNRRFHGRFESVYL